MRFHLGRLTLMTSVLCGLVALMSIPEFNPGHFRGSSFGTGIIGLWALALFVWAIGAVRRNDSRLRPRTLFLAIIAPAVMVSACPWLPVPYSMYSLQFVFAAISAAMVREAWHDDGQRDRLHTAFRGRVSRIVLGSAGLLGLAVVVHFWSHLVGLNPG